MKSKNAKGITLIALIITIVVLLILAGAAVSIALDTETIPSQIADAHPYDEHYPFSSTIYWASEWETYYAPTDPGWVSYGYTTYDYNGYDGGLGIRPVFTAPKSILMD